MTENTQETAWNSNLSDELKQNETLAKFKDLESFARNYLDLEKSSSSKIQVPSDDSSDDDWTQFYKKAGLPENGKYLPDEYRKKESESFLNLYEPLFRDSGLSKRQGLKLMHKMAEAFEDLNKKSKEESENLRKTNLDEISKRYGNDSKEKLKLAEAAISKYGNKDIGNLIEENNYNPNIVEMLINIGSNLKGDNLVSGDKKTEISSKKEALEEINRLYSDKEFMIKYKDKKEVGHKSSVEKMTELHKKAYN